jgi:hypothetical protein
MEMGWTEIIGILVINFISGIFWVQVDFLGITGKDRIIIKGNFSNKLFLPT